MIFCILSSYQESISLNTFHIHRSAGMYFLVFTGMRDDIAPHGHVQHGPYYPVHPCSLGSVLGNRDSIFDFRQTMRFSSGWDFSPFGPWRLPSGLEVQKGGCMSQYSQQCTDTLQTRKGGKTKTMSITVQNLQCKSNSPLSPVGAATNEVMKNM